MRAALPEIAKISAGRNPQGGAEQHCDHSLPHGKLPFNSG
jgi:hypothetical protein